MSNKRGEEPQLHFEHPDGFKPRAKVYKICCCHTKTFTIVLGVTEIFLICFLLVAVLPDVTTRICDHLGNSTMDLSHGLDDFEIQNVRNMTYMGTLLCQNNVGILIWAFVHVVTVVTLFYGVKATRWFLFIPHFIVRILMFCSFAIIEAWFVYTEIDGDDSTSYIVSIILFILLEIFVVFATYKEVMCAHFVKRSRETGFSITVARPIGPATISLSENNPPPPQEIRRLPPLRGVRSANQYIVQEESPQEPGNPNETNQ